MWKRTHHGEKENSSKFLHRPRVGPQHTGTHLGPGCAPSYPGHSKKERQRLDWLSRTKLNKVLKKWIARVPKDQRQALNFSQIHHERQWRSLRAGLLEHYHATELLGILLKCRLWFRRSGVGLIICISSELWSDADTLFQGPQNVKQCVSHLHLHHSIPSYGSDAWAPTQTRVSKDGAW